MGYRSQVRIMTTKDGYEKLCKFNDEFLATRTELPNDLSLLNLSNLDYFKIDNENQIVYLGWNWIKFYEEYNDISAILFAIRKLKENDVPYQFIRLGEDLSDIEEEYHLEKVSSKCNPFYVSTSIDGGMK